jgi:hypothetical protein
MTRLGLISAVLLSGCLAPLTSEDLAALDPSRRIECEACGAGQVCDAAKQQCVEAATLSGGVISACTRLAITARVTIGGSSTCSTSGKAYFQLSQLVPGGPQRLAAGKEGYEPVSLDLTLEPGFNTVPDLALTPAGGCSAGVTDVPCSCTSANCQ